MFHTNLLCPKEQEGRLESLYSKVTVNCILKTINGLYKSTKEFTDENDTLIRVILSFGICCTKDNCPSTKSCYKTSLENERNKCFQ